LRAAGNADGRALHGAHQGRAEFGRFARIALAALGIDAGHSEDAAEIGQSLAVGDVVAGHVDRSNLRRESLSISKTAPFASVTRVAAVPAASVAAPTSRRDAALGWNWTFYYKVLKPVLDELNPAGPLFPALVAPESKLPVKLEGISPFNLEFSIREAGGHVFLIAAKREGATVEARFSGLPFGQTTGDVLYGEPRQVSVSKGSFTDWFGPNEVHVYRFSKRHRHPPDGARVAHARRCGRRPR
jgi:hypothetical protein